LRYTRKRPLYADGRRQLGGEPPMHKRGEKPSIKEILYQNGYLELKDDGLPIHDKALMMAK
jgi:hypothetical protein